MRVIRQVRLSVWRTIKDLFEASSLMGSVYTVYGETELRAGTTPTRPFVYLLDFGVKFEMKNLPVVVIQVVSHRQALEMGTTQSYLNELALHIFGRDRGERDEISSALVEDMDSITIRDFDDPTKPVVATAKLEPERGRVWSLVPGSVILPDELGFEGSMDNWNTCVTRFWLANRALIP